MKSDNWPIKGMMPDIVCLHTGFHWNFLYVIQYKYDTRSKRNNWNKIMRVLYGHTFALDIDFFVTSTLKSIAVALKCVK